MVSQLASGDIRLINNCIQEIYSGLSSDAFPSHTLSAISKIIPAGIISYRTILPLKHKSIHFTIPSEIGSAKNHVIYTKFMHEHPHLNLLYPKEMAPHPLKKEIETKVDSLHISNKIPKTGWAVKISDFLTDKQWHKLGLYNELFHKIGAEHQLSLPILNTKAMHTALTFNRDTMDFSERERTMLNLLGPHIIQAYKNGEALANAEKKGVILERAIDEMESSVIVIGRDLRILFSTERAQRLLSDLFKTPFSPASHLPEKLAQWVKCQRNLLNSKDNIPLPPAPFVIDREDRRIVIRFIHDNKKEEYILLIREEINIMSAKMLRSFGITDREAIVLHWVARGKTNIEIAYILKVSTLTVKKHLEHIYQKLGVENRTSAAFTAIKAIGLSKMQDSIT